MFGICPQRYLEFYDGQHQGAETRPKRSRHRFRRCEPVLVAGWQITDGKAGDAVFGSIAQPPTRSGILTERVSRRFLMTLNDGLLFIIGYLSTPTATTT